MDLRPWLKARLGRKVEEHGDEWALPCPECDSQRTKDYRLWFNVKRNVGTCYKCHRSFNTTKLVQALEGVGFAQALRLIKEHTVGGVLSLALLRQHVEQAFTVVTEQPEEALPEVELPDEFKPVEPDGRFPAYIMERIGSIKTILDYGIGWCPRGFYRDRMVVPVRLHGRTVSFVARDMTGTAERKVLYPKGTKTSRVLFNYDRAKSFERVVLVEGALDAIRVGPRGMALFGTSISDAQVALLAKSEARDVVVMLDGDAAGEAGAEKVAKRLRTSFSVRLARLPVGTDPDDFERAVLFEKIDAALPLGGDLRSHVRRRLGTW